MGTWFRDNRDAYPEDWDDIATAVKSAKDWICEGCDREHAPPEVVLTVDHLDHDPGNSAEDNLLALCRRCHLRRQHLRPRPQTREDALARLRERAAHDRRQLSLFGLG